MLEPMEEIAASRDAAREAKDPMTDFCTLATVDDHGCPQARVVVLRDLHSGGVELMISRKSPKFRHLEATGKYQILLYWKTLGRQFRLSGDYQILPPEAREKVWSYKRHTSKLLEHFYEEYQEQSTPLASREDLVTGIASLKAKYPEASETPLPPSAAQILFAPHRVELWYGSEEDRLHRRWLATRSRNAWERQLLTP